LTIIGIAAILAGAAFALLVGFLVPVLIQVRKAVAQAEQLLTTMNDELPPLISQSQATSHNIFELTEQARIGIKHATVLLHAVGEVGESVQSLHRFMKGSLGSMLAKVASMVAG
jgi:uncharacterized protein YoxC